MRTYYDKTMTRPEFLSLPRRSEKPRRAGVTHVLDAGMPPSAVEDVLDSAGEFIDVWKLGWGTAYLDSALSLKVKTCARHGVLACPGGTLLEAAWLQGAADAFFDWVEVVGFETVEVSNGVSGMSTQHKRRLIEQAAERFTVLAEVGSKDPHAPVSPQAWADEAEQDAAAGARWILAEGRESGQAGLYRADRSVREEVVDALVDRVGLPRLVFEAPNKSQQAWLLRRFGPEVNLGNVAPDEVLGLEALRLGLRADTLPSLLPPGAVGRP